MLTRPTSLVPLCRSETCRGIADHQIPQPEDEEDDKPVEGVCLRDIPEEEEDAEGSGSKGTEEEGRISRRGGEEGRVGGLWGVGWRSEADIPASVAACFQDPSLLARFQARLLTLLGRASRYRLQSGINSPVMPLEVLRRKVKEARRLLAPHSSRTISDPSSSSTASSSPSTLSTSNNDSFERKPSPKASPRPRASSPGLASPCEYLSSKQEASEGTRPVGSTSLQQYWGSENSGAEEEIELLEQYLNLQQLAVSRKHSTQLRRIRDSLLARVRSRPSSMVKPIVPTASSSEALTTTPSSTPTKDRQALRNFLLDIGFVQYYSLLNRHGYDLATAAHMDALDLAGVGITEPLHRMAIKFELDLVKQPPPVPSKVPETCHEWLSSMGLVDYVENFHQNGIYCPLAALGLTKRDLQLMGIYMLGHRKKILLAILGLKEALLRKE